MKKIISGKSYLEIFEKDLNKKLEDANIKKEVCELMECYGYLCVHKFNETKK